MRYPTEETHFAKKADLDRFSFEPGQRGKLEARKIHWSLSGATVKDVVFRDCNFHTGHGQVAPTLSSLTFENCDFNSCFLGFVVFRRTTFRSCTFNRCEMSRTEFDECTFENCTFQQCTPWDAVLQRTLLDPTHLLAGFEVPSENLIELVVETRRTIEERYLRSRVALAEQLLRSNEERRNTIYSDRALFHCREEVLKWRRHEQRSKRLLGRLQALPALAMSTLYLRLTRGGTSLTRLLMVAVVICFTIALLLKTGTMDVTLRSEPTSALSFFECLAAAGSLFFAFGYTNFSASGGIANTLLTVWPLIGMAWSAVVLAVIVRRAYR